MRLLMAAVLTPFAAALTPPSAELVAGTSLAGKNLECAYLASRDLRINQNSTAPLC